MTDLRAAPGERSTGAAQTARAHYDRGLDLLERLVPPICAVGKGVLWLSIGSVLAVAAFVLAAVAVNQPESWATWLAVGVVAVVLLWPAGMLLVFRGLLHDVAGLPDKLRRLPDVTPEHASRLAALAKEAHARHRRVRWRSLPRDAWRIGRSLFRARDDIPWTSAFFTILRVPFLLLVVLAIVLASIELLLLPLALAVAAVAFVL